MECNCKTEHKKGDTNCIYYRLNSAIINNDYGEAADLAEWIKNNLED